MNKVYAKLFLFVTILAVLSTAYVMIQGEGVSDARKTEDLVPTKQVSPVSILTRDRRNTYYQLTAENEIEVQVTGPAYLRVITRYDFPAKGTSRGAYKILMTADRESRVVFEKQTRKSFISRYLTQKDRVPGKIRNLEVDVPDGKHFLKFTLPPDADYRVNLRFLIKRLGRPKESWAYYRPLEYNGSQGVLVRGKQRTYFDLSDKKGIVLQATGPTQFRIITRWLAKEPPLGRERYQVHVWEGEKEKLTRTHETGMAPSVVLANAPTQSALGYSKKVYINVPAGTHQYKVLATTGNKNIRVLARPFILRQKKLKLKKDGSTQLPTPAKTKGVNDVENVVS